MTKRLYFKFSDKRIFEMTRLGGKKEKNPVMIDLKCWQEAESGLTSCLN